MELEELVRRINQWRKVSPGKDPDCPQIEWMGEDLVRCPSVGEWKCRLQPEVYGDLLHGGGSENLDYKPCGCADYRQCEVYANSQSK